MQSYGRGGSREAEDVLYVLQYEQLDTIHCRLPAIRSTLLTLQHSSILEGNLLTRLLESLTLTSIPLQSEPLRALSSSFRGETDVFSCTKNLGWVENTPLLDTAPLHLALELRK